MRHIVEYSDYLLNLDLSSFDRGRIDTWLSQNKDSFSFSDDVQLSQSMSSIIQNIMQDLGFPQDKKQEVESYVSSHMNIQDDESVPVMVMSPYYTLQYADFVDGLSRYELN